MLRVAIAAENSEYDVEIYRVLLERLLGQPVSRMETEKSFSGWRSVRDFAGPFLKDAESRGVRRALFAIDNDGGRDCGPEHEPSHDQRVEAASEEGCRVCFLAEVIPTWWETNGGKTCIVVPVQVLETWLLCIRGTPPFAEMPPERNFHRRVLKGRFFGSPVPPMADRLRMALTEVQREDALTILRQRPSFQHFEAQLAVWI